jgi:hypothetical protein
MTMNVLIFRRFILGFLFLFGYGIIHQPTDLWGQAAILIPNGTLVYEGKVSSLHITKDETSITFNATTLLAVYLLFSDQDVLTGANVQLTIPTANYQGQMAKTSPGVYTLSISEQIKIASNNPYAPLLQIEQWQVEPLSYSLNFGEQSKIEDVGNFPDSIDTFGRVFKTLINQPSLVGYVRDANLNTSIGTAQSYQIDFVIDLRARLLDENLKPLINYTVEAIVAIPACDYSGTINITTDSEGIFTLTRQEPVTIKVTGGNHAVLAEPLGIHGVSFTAVSDLASVTGVVAKNGVPLKGAAVYIGGNPVIYTDTTGMYRGEVNADTATIVAVYTIAGEFIGEKAFTLGQGEILKADFDFTPWVITGNVTEKGAALSGSRVWAGRNKPILTDSSGSYSANVQGEEIKISAFTEWGEFIDEQTVVMVKGANQTADFDFNPVPIAGLVTENGAPLKDAKVYAGLNRPFFTNASGEYAIRATASGFTRVFAYTGDDEFIGEQMVTLDEKGTTIVNFDFKPVNIIGTITVNGVGISKADVYVGANLPVKTGATGQYSTRVQVGTWKVFAEDVADKLIAETTVQIVPQDIIVVNLP